MKYGKKFCESRPGRPNAAGRFAMPNEGLSGDKIRSIPKGNVVGVAFALLGELGGELMVLSGETVVLC
jgi:hypothetical protein